MSFFSLSLEEKKITLSMVESKKHMLDNKYVLNISIHHSESVTETTDD